MKRKITISFIIICVAIISTPFILVNLRIKVDPLKENEKKISLNFKRNFPLKSDLLKIYTNFKTNILNVNPIPNKVIETENEWKFLGNNFSNALSESKGLVVFTKKELASLKKFLILKKEWLKERNIAFYIAIAPNKHTIHSDMIKIKKYERNTKLQQLDSLCKIIDVNFINLGANFPKGNDTILYHKTDTHWNGYAGFYAYQSSMNFITRDFKKTIFGQYKLDNMEAYVEDNKIGDLNNMLMNNKTEDFIHLKFKTPEKAIEQTDQLTVPIGYHNADRLYEKRFQNASSNNNLKILVFHDSFFPYYEKYFSETFNHSVFIWNHKFDKDVIEIEKPNILYHEIVERDIDVLLNR
ncbi:alginate O-acetyltransferase AlgX-related protein [Aquimarina spinulae]|uniref:alginate O-acetyltransferase AlgX-related protein n=1 Tax=Aquimarina spinulae TaxID=1192023 RepID=UPI000D55D0C9|nr:hypothetical protein [Aquimarina spinulae]